MAFTPPDPARARRILRLRLAAMLLGVALVGWQSRNWILTAVGAGLAVEDPLASVDVIVASVAAARADTIEAARLHQEGFGRRVVVARWRKESLDDEMRRLGVPWLPPTELAVAMLERSGVPSDTVRVLEGPVDGLNTEITTLARFVHTERPVSLLFVTARSHTRRARWLLQRLLPEGTTLLVRAPRTDPFQADTWWHSRTGGREVAMEYLRWFNTFVFRDPWSQNPPSVPEAAE